MVEKNIVFTLSDREMVNIKFMMSQMLYEFEYDSDFSGMLIKNYMECLLMMILRKCEFDKEIKVKKLQIKTDKHGYRFIITIDVPFGTQLTGKIHNLQKYIIENIEKYTGILIEEVSIVIDKITQ